MDDAVGNPYNVIEMGDARSSEVNTQGNTVLPGPVEMHVEVNSLADGEILCTWVGMTQFYVYIHMNIDIHMCNV